MFKPSSFSHVIGCKKQLKFLNEYFKKKEKKPILCLGNIGTGKTFIINLFIKKFKLTSFLFNEYNILDDEQKKIINKLLHQQNLSFFYNKSNNDTIILIDGIHNIQRKSIIDTFLNQKKHYCIFIGNNTHFKYKSILKDKCLYIEFNKPKIQDIISFFHLFINNMNIKSTIDNDVLKKYVKYIDKDYKQLLYFLEYLYINNPIEWNNEYIQYHIKNHNKKQIHYELYDGCSKILYSPLSLIECEKIMKKDYFLMSKLIHENYISSYIQTKHNDIFNLTSLSKYLMYSNQFEQYFDPISNSCSSILSSYPFNKELSNKSKKIVPQLTFTKVINSNKDCNKYFKLIQFDIKGLFLFDELSFKHFLHLHTKLEKLKEKKDIFSYFKDILSLNDNYKIEFKKQINLFI